MKKAISKLQIVALGATLCASMDVLAAAGTFLLATGNVEVINASGAKKTVKTGDGFDSGDTVLTREGRAQLRFTDAGLISLKPDTEFKIADYRFSGGEGNNESAFFSLLKGGMRAITGLIGHSTRKDYRVETATATIGIRGTEFLAQLCAGNCKEPDGLYVQTGEGVVFVKNAAGEIDVAKGQTAYVASPQTAPEQTSSVPPLNAATPAPSTPDVAVTEVGVKVGEIVGANTLGNAVPLTAASLTGVASGSIEGTSLSGTTRFAAASGMLDPSFSGIVGVYLNNGQVTGAIVKDNDGNMGSISVDSVQNAGSTGDMVWGRWSNTVLSSYASVNGTIATDTVSIPDTASLHYVLGTSVPTVPTTGTANFGFVGGTPSTDSTGGLGSGITGGTLTADFSNNIVDAWFSVVHGNTYNITAHMPVDSTNRTVFSSTNSGGSVSGAAAGSVVDGFFSGTSSPTGAGISYSLTDGAGIVGVGAFDATHAASRYVSLTSAGLTGVASGAITLDGTTYTGASHTAVGSGQLTTGSSDVVGVYMSGNQVTGLMVSDGTRTAKVGVDSARNAFNSGDMYWGNWSNTTISTYASDNGTVATASQTIPATASLHYLLGTSVPTVPVTGTASFNFIGGTPSTDGTGGVGPGITSGTLTADFSANAVGASFTVVHGSSYSIGAGMPMDSGNRAVFSSTNPGGFVIGAAAAGSTVEGFFVGSDAPTGAGISYSLTNGTGIVGVGAFSSASGSSALSGTAGTPPGAITESTPPGSFVSLSAAELATTASGSITIDGTSYVGAHSASALSGQFGTGSPYVAGVYMNTNQITGLKATDGASTAIIGVDSAQDAGNSGNLYWGRWTNTNLSAYAAKDGTTVKTTQTIPSTASLHYILGTSTPTVPVTGTASFGFVGGTPSTDQAGGTGSGITAGTVTANFTANTVGANFTVVHGGTFNVSANMPMDVGNRAVFSSTNLGGSVSGAAAGSTVAGFLSGSSSPTGAGISYSLKTGATSGVVGVGAFAVGSGGG